MGNGCYARQRLSCGHEVQIRKPGHRLPPFTRETAGQKVRGAEDAWNSRDPDRVVKVYTEDTALAKSCGVSARPRRGTCVPRPQMGTGAGLPADQGTLGVHRAIALPCGSPTSGTTIQGNGFAAMATRTGNSMKRDSCSDASQASMTCPSMKHSASSAGHPDAGRMTIRRSASWGCRHMRLAIPWHRGPC